MVMLLADRPSDCSDNNGCAPQTEMQLLDEELDAGGTVEIGFGVVFEEGEGPGQLKPSDEQILQGIKLWLDVSGAGSDGFPVGAGGGGRVKVRKYALTATKDATCADFVAKAKQLVEVHQVRRMAA